MPIRPTQALGPFLTSTGPLPLPLLPPCPSPCLSALSFPSHPNQRFLLHISYLSSLLQNPDLAVAGGSTSNTRLPHIEASRIRRT